MDVNKSALKTDSPGFTLVELLIVIAIVGILAAIAYPSFDSSIKSGRITSETKQIVSALQFARSEAIVSGLSVTVCSSVDQAACNSDDDASWGSGYIVLKEGELLKTYDAMHLDLQVYSPQSITFSHDGTPSDTSKITLCDSRGLSYATGIHLNGSGQIRTGEPSACQ